MIYEAAYKAFSFLMDHIKIASTFMWFTHHCIKASNLVEIFALNYY